MASQLSIKKMIENSILTFQRLSDIKPQGHRIDKGKPSESWGRKATGLTLRMQAW